MDKSGRRREMKPWRKLAEKGGGGGGVLILGGALIAAAVGAGTAVVARRALRRRPSSLPGPPAVDAGEKAEEIKDFDGENGEKECQIGREANTRENISFSKNPDLVETKESVVEVDVPNGLGEEEVRSIYQIEQTWEESEFVLVDGMEKEIEVDRIESHADLAQNSTIQVLEKSELILVDEVGKEKEMLPTESQLAVSKIALIDEVKEVEESLPSESEFGIHCGQTEQSAVALDDEELTKAEVEIVESNDARILNSEFSKEDLQSVHVTAELVLSPTEGIKKEQVPGDERTACIEDIAELVSTATQEIKAELVSAATAEIKNEESGSEITACVEEIAELVLAATKSINIEECRSLHISAELVLADPEEIEDEENSSDGRTPCAEEIAELLLAATEQLNLEECQSDHERATLVLAAANEILKEEDTGVCIGKVDEGIQSTNLELSVVERQSDCIRDETVLDPADEIKREEEILLQESQVEMAEHESEINEQEEEGASSIEIQEESKSQLQLSQEEEEEEDKETLSTESEHDIEENEDKPQLNTEDSQSNESAFATRKEIEEEEEEFPPSEHQLEMTQYQPQPIFKRVEISIMKEIHKSKKGEGEEAEAPESSAEMREEVSSAESNTETVCLTTVIEQKMILPAVQLKEEQKEIIMVKKFYPLDNSLNERECKGANDILQNLGEIEEEEQEQKESIPTKREKTPRIDGFFMDHDQSRLFMVLLGMALVLAILCFFNSSHFAKLSSQLYQVIFPTVEETQQIEL